MKHWRTLVLSLAVPAFFLAASAAPAAAPTKPNILIIYIDDLGFGDLAITGNVKVPTPNMDSLARNGARFSDSYVTACVCSPSRAALMTGRYQQRFGFDANAEGAVRKGDRSPHALDIQQTTFAQRFKQLGYATGLVGKWHLGASEGYLPVQRGFDEFYGLLPHGVGAGKGEEPVPIYRGTNKVAIPADHTVAFGAEAEAYIDRHHDQPWFLYLAFTAVHAPHSAPEEFLKRYASLDKAHQLYYGMIACADEAVGKVLAKLRQYKLEENTLIFFASDNGGPTSAAVSNGPFRGGKWTLWEGGIRSPVFVQWKGHIAPGRELNCMVTQLDWLPTALAAAGAEVKPEYQFDGVNLLPLLEGKTTAPPHDTLFWRFGVQYAVRQGDWKLVKPSINSTPKLFNLAKDNGEATDLAAKEPEKLKQLQALWDAWNAKNEAPRWNDERWNGLEEKAENKKEKKAKKK